MVFACRGQQSPQDVIDCPQDTRLLLEGSYRYWVGAFWLLCAIKFGLREKKNTLLAKAAGVLLWTPGNAGVVCWGQDGLGLEVQHALVCGC